MGVHVFWDWNGTLCDDVLLSLEAVNQMLRKRSRAPIGLDEYYRYIDVPISRFYAHLFDLNELPMAVISDEFQAYYRAHLRTDCLTPGALDALNELRDAGAKQYLLTSSHRESVLPTLEKLDLLPYFDAFLAAEDWGALPKADRAKAFCDANGLCGQDVWFVGDQLHDWETARACGASCLLLPTGHQSEETLRSAGPCFCPSLAAVPSRILGAGEKRNLRKND